MCYFFVKEVMKIKILIAIFALPFLALAGVMSILRLIFSVTIMFAWVMATDWRDGMLCWVNDKLNQIKKK